MQKKFNWSIPSLVISFLISFYLSPGLLLHIAFYHTKTEERNINHVKRGFAYVTPTLQYLHLLSFIFLWVDFPGGSGVNHTPANAGDMETQFQSLVREDPLELEMATHSSILGWKISWTEEPGGLQFTG